MTKIQIRPATAADAAGIAQVHVQSWRESYAGIVPEGHLAGLDAAERTRRWHKTASRRQNRSGAPLWPFPAPGRGKPKASSASGRRARISAALRGELYALYLLRTAQGQGAGRRLFDAARQSLKSCGINGVYLWVLADNPSAGFYRHMGGREIRRKVLEIGGKELEEIAYGWEEL